MSEKDKGNLLAILEAVDKINSFTSGIPDAAAFYNDAKTFDATLMNFIVIGESVTRLSDTLKNKHTGIDWVKIKGFRNVIAHDYFGIDAEEIWQIIINHLPQLKKDILTLLADESF